MFGLFFAKPAKIVRADLPTHPQTFSQGTLKEKKDLGRPETLPHFLKERLDTPLPEEV